MYRFAVATLAFVVLSATNAFAQKSDSIMPIGKWSGVGTFFKQNAHEQFGTIPIALESTNGSAVTGKVGGAVLVDGRARKIREVIEITGKLAGAVIAKPGLETKDRFVLLVTSRGDSSMNAEFHLKSNAWFDARMMEGRVVLRR